MRFSSWIGEIAEQRYCDNLRAKEFVKSQTDATSKKAADVILCVYDLGLKESEICDLFEFGPTERQTVLRKIRSWRYDENSPLRQLAKFIYGGAEDE